MPRAESTLFICHTECYCIRLLLTRVREATNFLALKTVNGYEKATFREACIVLGLLEDNNHWNNTLEDAVLCWSVAKVESSFLSC